MPLGSNVQISFSQLQSEFGGTGEIRLSDYTSTFAYDTQEVNLFSTVPLDGVDSVYIVCDDSFTNARTSSYNLRGIDPITVFVGMKLKIKMSSNANSNIYLSSTPYKGNANINLPGLTTYYSTGVTSAPGFGIRAKNDFMVLNTSSYIPNNSQYNNANIDTVSVWLKTDANPVSNIWTQSIGAGNIFLSTGTFGTPGFSIPIKIISRPAIERVRLFADYVDVTWPSNLSSGSDVIKLNSGGFSTWHKYFGYFSGRNVRIGQNLTFKVNVSALPSFYSSGTYLAIYFPVYVITSFNYNYGGTPFISFGSGHNPGWFSSLGPIVSFIGGSGLSNTAENVAQCLADAIGSSPRAPDANQGLNGMTATASRSGTTLTVTLFNNSPFDLTYFYYGGATDNTGSFTVGYYDPSFTFSLTHNSPGWSSQGQSQVFGGNLVSYVVLNTANVQRVAPDANAFISPAQTGASTLASGLLNSTLDRINDSLLYVDPHPFVYYGQFGHKSLTNGFRIISGYNSGEVWANVYYAGADTLLATNAQFFDSKKVSLTGNYLTPGPGSSNFEPTIANFSNNNVYIDSRFTANTRQSYNHYVKQLKKDMSLSDYWNGYGNVALGL